MWDLLILFYFFASFFRHMLQGDTYPLPLIHATMVNVPGIRRPTEMCVFYTHAIFAILTLWLLNKPPKKCLLLRIVILSIEQDIINFLINLPV